MNATKTILAILMTLALGFTAEKAQACATHLSTVGTGSTDAGCLFNVSVSADDWVTKNEDEFGGESGIVNDITSALSGQGAPAEVNFEFDGGEGDVSFQIPAGVHQVTITLTDQHGAQDSITEVLVNNKFQLQSSAPANAQNPCGPNGYQPPLNTAVPGPGIDPNDNMSAMDDLQKANVPLADERGDKKSGQRDMLQ
jgi:hypothetical protein